MSEVLVVVEATAEFGVKKVTLEMLTLARELGTPSAVVLGGAGAAEALAGKLGEYGAEKIYAAEGDQIDGYLVAPSKPTSVGATPRSARDNVRTGFFLAAMMPLKEG